MATMMAVDDEDNEVDGDGATTNHYLVSTLVKHSTNTVSYLQSNHFFFFQLRVFVRSPRRFCIVCPL
jgi:hypothetical protein